MESSGERKPPSRGIEVKLLDHSSDPIRSLYVAYRVAYSSLTPIQIVRRIEDDRITRDQMLEFIEKRLETGHASPLEQVWFEFAIAGVTRAFSHQFVRHHMGISFEQQSQRYVTFKGGEFPYTVPESVKRRGLDDEMNAEFDRLAALYDRMIQAGVPAEDARFVLPNATNTNFKVTVNFLELLHIADLRLCTRAQWEFRRVVSLMRAEVVQRFPEIGRYMQPKCGEYRLGYCDESLEAWAQCPIGKKRPHRTTLFEAYTAFNDQLQAATRKKARQRSVKQNVQTPSLFDPVEFLSEDAAERANYLAKRYVVPKPLTDVDFALIEKEESST